MPWQSDEELAALLRWALATSGEGFDLPALVAGTMERVDQRRRRQAAVNVAVTGVLTVALVVAWHEGLGPVTLTLPAVVNPVQLG